MASEGLQSARPLLLAAVAVDGRAADAAAVQVRSQPAGPELAASEDQNLVHRVAPDQVNQQIRLAFLVDRIEDLGQVVGDAVPRGNLDRFGVSQEFAGEPPDIVRERGREEQSLALGRHEGDDLADIGDEAHVQHSIGLVQDEDLDLGEVHGLLADMVHQTTGCGDEDLDALPQDLDLRVDAGAAVHDRRAQGAAPAVGLDGLADLDGELTGRRQDQHSDGVPGRREAAVGVPSEALQCRQNERGRLAGSGLGCGKDVASGQDEGNCRALDGRRLRVALSRNCGEKVGREAEFFESQTVTPECAVLARDRAGRAGRFGSGAHEAIGDEVPAPTWHADGRRCCSVSETAIDKLMLPPCQLRPEGAIEDGSCNDGREFA